MENTNASEIVTFEIRVNGTLLPDYIQVPSIRVDDNINQVASAQIVVGNAEKDFEDFADSTSHLFAFGATITIGAGYSGQNTTIFSGIITGQSMKIGTDSPAIIEIECNSLAIKMTAQKKNEIFKEQTDSTVIETVISYYSGLSGKVGPTKEVVPEVAQENTTDWDFIVALARTNSMIVKESAGEVIVKQPNTDSQPSLTIGYGENLLAFYAGTNALSNLCKIEQNPASKVQGILKISGNGTLSPDTTIQLSGLGNTFTGTQYVSGVSHTITDGNWFSMVTIGVDDDWFPVHEEEKVVTELPQSNKEE